MKFRVKNEIRFVIVDGKNYRVKGGEVELPNDPGYSFLEAIDDDEPRVRKDDTERYGQLEPDIHRQRTGTVNKPKQRNKSSSSGTKKSK